MSGGIWHRGWLISKAFFGWSFQHPGFDPENDLDWRCGSADSEQQARDEIDALLAEDAEWDAAVSLLKGMQA